ncbi:MAG: SDR family NAD(P)-dependent oxidoreductase [Acidimicrobiales bacterium]
MATNLIGYFRVARAFARHFVAQRCGSFVNVTMNHETMRRRGFIPYGPSRAGAESLNAIMAEDLREDHVSVNILLPGGATTTGMIPDDVEPILARALLDPTFMGPPVVFLASARAAGLSRARLVATEFEQWLATYEAGLAP